MICFAGISTYNSGSLYKWDRRFGMDRNDLFSDRISWILNMNLAKMAVCTLKSCTVLILKSNETL